MRLIGDVYAVLLLLAVVAGLRVADGSLGDLSAAVGSAGPAPLDAALGWLPVGGLLALLAVIALRTLDPLPLPEKLAYGVLALPWVVLATAYFWSPFGASRDDFLARVGEGGRAFRDGVVLGQWALPFAVLGIVAIALAQLASPRWQAGSRENEWRSHRAAAAALGLPSLAALATALARAV